MAWARVSWFGGMIELLWEMRQGEADAGRDAPEGKRPPY
jgi:hypothetical protein